MEYFFAVSCLYLHIQLPPTLNTYASCNDCCIELCWSWSVVVVVVECCCCIPYRLALMLVLTFAPSVLTFAPCACGVILLSTSASTPLAHMVVVTGCNLRWWCFTFNHWRKHSLHRWWSHPLQLALVVFFFPSTGAHTSLALEQLALWWWSVYIYIYLCMYIYIFIFVPVNVRHLDCTIASFSSLAHKTV